MAGYSATSIGSFHSAVSSVNSNDATQVTTSTFLKKDKAAWLASRKAQLEEKSQKLNSEYIKTHVDISYNIGIVGEDLMYTSVGCEGRNIKIECVQYETKGKSCKFNIQSVDTHWPGDLDKSSFEGLMIQPNFNQISGLDCKQEYWVSRNPKPTRESTEVSRATHRKNIAHFLSGSAVVIVLYHSNPTQIQQIKLFL